MIAVNIMSIEVTALAFDDNLVRIGEVFSEPGAGEMPVLKADKVLAGVLSKASLPEALKEMDKTPNAVRGSRTAGCLCKRFFKSAAPGDAFLELKEMLKGADERSAYVYIVDNAGRLLGLVELKGFLEAGVNRLSIGVQSLDAGELRTLGRRHGPGEALTAARNARLAGFKNVSLDLIYGLPGQTSLSWSATLEGVLALSSDHISLYNLSIEDNTPFSKLYGGQGERPFMDEDLERSMYEDAIAKLFSKGYEHYEISNFAMPGFKSAHNEGYWMGRDYMGLGPGAHSFLNDSAYGPWGRRSWNEADIESYKRALGEGSPLAGFELLSREEAMEEAVLLGLRMLDRGLDLNSYERAFGREAREKLLVKCIGLEADGLLHIQGNKASLDKSALFISNEVCLGLVS